MIEDLFKILSVYFFFEKKLAKFLCKREKAGAFATSLIDWFIYVINSTPCFLHGVLKQSDMKYSRICLMFTLVLWTFTINAHFDNYLTNSNIREFIELQELIDLNDINAALMANGVLVAQNVIETNLLATNNIILNTLVQDVDLDSPDRQNLFVIAMLTPYIGGEGVYSARAMLGIDPEDYNLPYRKGKTITEDSTRHNNLVKVYPNPANNQIIIEIPSVENMYIEIFDVYGKFVSGYPLSKIKNLLDISTFSKGVFIFKITNLNGVVESGKFIKL